ncbi:MAG: glycosyltransferase family 4 protein [Betaproteobacteria bacterium]
MRIAFDGTTLRPGRTGVGYYTEHLLHHLAQEATDDELVVLSNQPVDTTRPLPRGVRVANGRWLTTRTSRMLWMQVEAPRMLQRLEADVVHFTNGMMPLTSRVPTVVTIHDMSLTLYPRLHPLRRVLLNRPLVNLAARRADAIITVSESARRDITRLYNLPPSRVHVIHEAASPSFRPVRDPREIARIRARYGLAERAILYVGTIEPRKNLSALIDAFAARRRGGELRGYQLVCAGPYGWLSRGVDEQIRSLKIGHAIRFTGYVPFDDLPALYSASEMFVFPSLYEGFGLPVVEAMACGTPVVTGRTPALAEVAGGAIEQACTLDAEGIGDAMVRLARSPDRRAHRAALGLQRAQTFSWTRAARETLAVYRKAAGRTPALPALEPMPAYADLRMEPMAAAAARDARRVSS